MIDICLDCKYYVDGMCTQYDIVVAPTDGCSNGDKGGIDMADVELIIKIPEEMYQKIKETSRLISGRRSGKRFDYILFNAVNNGTPLPKGHGRLIDADKLWDYYHDLDYDFYEAFDLADTIIEAESDDENVGH